MVFFRLQKLKYSINIVQRFSRQAGQDSIVIIRLLKTGLMLGTVSALSACGISSVSSYLAYEAKAAQKSTLSGVPVTHPSMGASLNAQHSNASEWEIAYRNYEQKTEIYWNEIATKRKLRNEKRRSSQTIALEDYVLRQPPVYDGPARPVISRPMDPGKTGNPIPATGDFLAAAQKIYGFKPDRPRTETEFMYTYAAAAARTGLTREQLVSLYAFETGGDGTYDLQAGMSRNRKNATPISTAIGYNQLVATASVSVMSEFGPTIAAELREQARQSPRNRRRQLQQKARTVEKMTARARQVPHQWSAQGELAKIPPGLGIHAMTLDKDVGPLLQLHKLRTSMNFLKANNITHTLSGAELEMLNLTGDGNGLDVITMPHMYRDRVPTANFFVRKGYERNPIARRNATAGQLLQAIADIMQTNMQKDGAQELYRAFQSREFARN